MPQLEISHNTVQKIEQLSKQAQITADEVLQWLLDNYGHTITLIDQNTSEDVTWTDEELDELLKPHKPLTGKQIVEKHLKTGVIGSWADMGITDSVEWLKEQRAKHANKYQW